MLAVALLLLAPHKSAAPAILAGTKGSIAYAVRTRTPPELPEATEIAIDLAEILDPPDPDFGTRKPLAMKNATVIALVPGEKQPRAKQRLYALEQNGRYMAHLPFRGDGYGFLRVDAELEGGKTLAVMLPVAFGTPKGKELATRVLKPDADEPVRGSGSLGALIYAKHCACCHGASVSGTQGKAPRFDAPEFAWARSDDIYRGAIGTDTLAAEDLLAYLSPFRPPLGQIAPAAERYLARPYSLDEPQKKRLRRLIGHPLKNFSVALFPLYRTESGDKRLQLLGNDSRALEQADPKLRLGYVAVVRGGTGEPAPELWLALDNAWHITRLLARDGHAQALRNAPALGEYDGQGSREDGAVPAHDQLLQNDPWAMQIAAAYVLTTTAARAYESEESDRTWAK
jgi:cytochrome c5